MPPLRACAAGTGSLWSTALSLGVWCTSWAFYGSVGHAAFAGFGFALTYVGPALMLLVGFPVLQKIARTAKTQNVTSIADFMGARYGEPRGRGPGYAARDRRPHPVHRPAAAGGDDHVQRRCRRRRARGRQRTRPTSVWHDTALYVALAMALFAALSACAACIRTSATEGDDLRRRVRVARQSGGLCRAGGVRHVLTVRQPRRALAERVSQIPALAGPAHYRSHCSHTGSRSRFSRASRSSACRGSSTSPSSRTEVPRICVWQRGPLPLLLVAMALFVPAVAAAGLLVMPRSTMPELFPLMLPIRADQPALALAVFIGGLSAATATIIVEVVALSTMICNELVVPVLVRRAAIHNGTGTDMTRLLLRTRWIAAFAVLLASYAFHKATAHTYSLASIGIISLVAVAQFAPALFIGLYWRRAHRHGVVAGLIGGLACGSTTCCCRHCRPICCLGAAATLSRACSPRSSRWIR